MSIKLSDGSRVSIDLEDKETIARIVSTRKAEEEKAKLKQEVTPQVPKEEPRKEVSSLTIKGFLVSIPFSILGFLEFYAIDILTTLLLSLLFLGFLCADPLLLLLQAQKRTVCCYHIPV